MNRSLAVRPSSLAMVGAICTARIDCTVGCAVAASMQGSALPEHAPRPKPPRPKITLSELYRRSTVDAVADSLPATGSQVRLPEPIYLTHDTAELFSKRGFG